MSAPEKPAMTAGEIHALAERIDREADKMLAEGCTEWDTATWFYYVEVSVSTARLIARALREYADRMEYSDRMERPEPGWTQNPDGTWTGPGNAKPAESAGAWRADAPTSVPKCASCDEPITAGVCSQCSTDTVAAATENARHEATAFERARVKAEAKRNRLWCGVRLPRISVPALDESGKRIIEESYLVHIGECAPNCSCSLAKYRAEVASLKAERDEAVQVREYWRGKSCRCCHGTNREALKLLEKTQAERDAASAKIARVQAIEGFDGYSENEWDDDRMRGKVAGWNNAMKKVRAALNEEPKR